MGRTEINVPFDRNIKIRIYMTRYSGWVPGIIIFASVYMAMRDRLIANIPVLNGLLAACK